MRDPGKGALESWGVVGLVEEGAGRRDSVNVWGKSQGLCVPARN